MKHIKTEEQGLKKASYENGELKLETFKIKDKLANDREMQTVIVTKRQQVAFEKDLIMEAQAYCVEASKRLIQESGQRKTTRKSLTEIYAKMLEKHPEVVRRHYALNTYGLKEEDECFKSFKQAYPVNFKRYFCRLIKTLNGKAVGKMSNR